MSIVTKVEVRGYRREITTEDGAVHRVLPDAPPDVSSTGVICGEAYPFVDDENGNAVAVA